MGSDELRRARDAMAGGDVLLAFDHAMEALESAPDDADARYLVALSLTRLGCLERAAEEIHSLCDTIDPSTVVDRDLARDAFALAARISKDRALARDDGRADALIAAADQYESVANTFGGFFPLINAASLRRLGGDVPGANRLARAAITAAAEVEHDYWSLATTAEGYVVLGDIEQARALLEAADRAAGTDLACRATTRRQLRVLCEALSLDPALPDVLRVPGVVHYCGHIASGIRGRWRSGTSGSELAAEVERVLDDHDVGFAYGSLAAGADIVVAEAVLARGGELRVVLPFCVDEFVHVSVRPAGESWLERFERCLGSATEVLVTCDSAFGGDNELFVHGSRVAMGLAVNRARPLTARVLQIALWDGGRSRGPGGTADDVETWRRAGLRSEVIRMARPEGSTVSATRPEANRRKVRGVVFTDLKDFSQLRDEDYPRFVDEVLGRIGDVLRSFGSRVLYRNTWGDAVQLVLQTPRDAAECALDLQAAIKAISATQGGRTFQMRAAVHAGPVLERRDPVRQQNSWWGRELTRAARIEPRTPEGDVYATEQTAAWLALEPPSDLTCQYVGRVTTAKGFETIPMYRLTRS